MNREWNDNQPIYRQLRDRVVHMILDGLLKEGDPLPSVRNVAAEYRVNPLTVLKAYQELVDEDLVEKRRGLGMFVKDGARKSLLKGERQKFLSEHWPQGTRNHSTARAGSKRIARCRNPQIQTERTVAETMATIEARGLRKAFGTTVALDGIDLHVEEGRILGLVGPNGAGKTTALNAILGLTSYQGELKVLGRDPWTQRDELMRDVSFIADVAVLPRWIRVTHLLDYVAGVHPRFDRAKAEEFSGEDHDQAHQQGKRIIERDGGPTAPRAGHGDRREIAGAGRADAWPGHPLSQTILRFTAERLLRSQPHDRRNHAPGGRGPGCPYRSHVHQPRPDRAPVQHGRIRLALRGSDGESRACRQLRAR